MSFIIDDAILEEIRERADIVDVISQYVQLKKSGTNYMGLCPFHHEKTPSFSVSQSKGIFKCFGCGQGGDQITFIMKKENLGFREAVKFLADKYGITLKEGNPENNEEKLKKERAYDANKEAAKFFMESLRKSKVAMDYLTKRDLDIKTINSFGIGYAPDTWESLCDHLFKKGFSKEELVEYNLASKSKNGNYIDRFRNRIMYPIIDTKRRVLGFGGRVLDDSLPKYLNTRDTIIFNKGHHLYNLNIVSEQSDREKIILVEGYMDVISMYKSGINYSVASLGTSLTTDQARLIKRYGKEVYICYDGDSAGIKATNRAIDVLISENVSPRILILPENLDPDDYMKKYGKLNFEIELNKSINYLEYKILKTRENFNINSSEGLSGFTSEVSKILARIKNPISRDVYIDKISREYGVSKEAIKNYISILNKEKNNKKQIKKAVKNINPNKKINVVQGRFTAELQLISYSICSLDNLDYIKNKLEAHEFKNTNFRIIFEEIKNIQTENIEDIKNKIYELRDMGVVDPKYVELLNEVEIDKFNSKSIIDDLLYTINKNNLEKRRRDILKEINDLESNSSDRILDIKNLIEELNEINLNLNSSQNN